MKKTVALLLLFLFLVSNTGVAVTMHYCGGRLSSVVLFSFYQHPCKCGKKTMKRDCCNDKIIFLNMKTDGAQTNHFVFKISSPQFILFTSAQTLFVPQKYFKNITSDFYHPPPFKPKVPIYSLDGAFLI